MREDAGCCPADVVFGDQLRLPGDLLDPGHPSPTADSAFAADLQSAMARLRPLPPVRRGPPLLGHVPSHLDLVSHVFLRVDSVRRPLTPPYDGLFAVLERGSKTFKILKSGKEVTVSIDRLKPAFLSDIFKNDSPATAAPRPGPVPLDPRLDPVSLDPRPYPLPPDPCPDPVPLAPTDVSIGPPLTFSRSGRVVRPPSRFLP